MYASNWLILLATEPQMNYQYKHLVGAMIVAGWDEQEGGQVSTEQSAGLLCTWWTSGLSVGT